MGEVSALRIARARKSALCIIASVSVSKDASLDHANVEFDVKGTDLSCIPHQLR